MCPVQSQLFPFLSVVFSFLPSVDALFCSTQVIFGVVIFDEVAFSVCMWEEVSAMPSYTTISSAPSHFPMLRKQRYSKMQYFAHGPELMWHSMEFLFLGVSESFQAEKLKE